MGIAMEPMKRNGEESGSKEKRKYPRINLEVQVSCVSLNREGLPMDQNKGYLKDVSQGGVAIEADEKPLSDRLVVVFTDAENQAVGILGKVAYAKKMRNGNHWIGLSFLAETKENIDFVSKAVKLYHYYKNAIVD
jgi:hypothetical protein